MHAQWKSNDTIWVTGTANCNTGPAGETVTIFGGGTSFSYPTPGGCTTAPSATVIGASDSFPIPYESPYMTAYRAALTATFLHFGPDYMLNSAPVASQLGYIRFGQAVGGEADPYCPTYMESLSYVFGGGTGLPSQWPCAWTGYTSADLTTDVDCMGVGLTSPNPGYYGGTLQWAQSQHPFMKIYAPLNQVGGDNNYGKREAGQASMYTNGRGVLDGFGSQGSSLRDTSAGQRGCGNSTSYWCNAFNTYYSNGGALELQQAGLSDPRDSICIPPLSFGVNGCATPPLGDSGDLRTWLPFEAANHANVIELYYLDAALAFDPNYCTSVTGGICVGYALPTFNDWLDTTSQARLFNAVGQGTLCPAGSGGGPTGTGNCSYAIVINALHAPH